jgi:hypothetical protein
MKPIDRMPEDEFAQLVRRAVGLPDAPVALVRSAVGLWAARAPSLWQAAAKAALHRLVAAVTFDSWAAGTMAFGVRGVPEQTRHLVYSAGGRDIDVRIAPAAKHFALTGQVLGPDESGMIELARASGHGGETAGAKVATLDPLGEFRIEGIPGGSYVLRLLLGEDEIVLPPIELGARRG